MVEEVANIDNVAAITAEKSGAEIIEQRKKKLSEFFKKTNVWVILLVIALLVLGIYIRVQPMTNHNGHPGLWDVTTNSWTLGPDLDPYLFLRQAKQLIEQGSLPNIDYMRNVPLGFANSQDTRILTPYMIALTYKITSIFTKINVDYAGVVFPVIMFALTIIAFFFFVREIFRGKDKESKVKANIIALISSLFMIIIPAFLSRTVAGIPEKESSAFFFMFLAFYLFLKAWKTENLKVSILLSVLAGISTGIMGLVWGGISYAYVTIGGAVLIAFILNKVHKKEFIIYLPWLLISVAMISIFGNVPLTDFLIGADTALAFLVLFIMVVHFAIWKTKIKELKILKKIKLPENIISLIIAIILGIVVVSVIFGPNFIFNEFASIYQTLFKPVTGRWNTTVAENRQPYFTEWGASFGPFLQGIPVLFWLFFIGSVVLFKQMLNSLKKKDSWVLTGLYIFFLLGLVFSRYAPHPAALDGEGLLSKVFYLGSAILLIVSLIYFYIKYHKEKHPGFQEIKFEYLLLFTLFILCLFTARSAVRLIMVLAPIAPIFVGYLIVELIDRFRKSKDETWRIVLGACIIIVLLGSIFVGITYYKQIKSEAYNYVPSYYNVQWQKAMAWVRDNTPEEAVFGHWWDYGYWLQSIGDRATVLDGGNAAVYWNYLMGRYALTGDNQADALEFLYNHNATYFLIDSSDIGKYGAFSSIGSDLNYDRYSWVPTMVANDKQTQETKDGQVIIFNGGFALDEDFTYNSTNGDVFLLAYNAGIAGVILGVKNTNNTISFTQPEAVFSYQGKQYNVPMRYVNFNGQLTDFKSGIEGALAIIPRADQNSQGLSFNQLGAAIYISPRVLRGFLAQKYILNDPFNKFPNFKLAHTEDNTIIALLKAQGAKIGDFLYFNGLQGPIKIWQIQYTGNEKYVEEYVQKMPPKSITWQF